MHPIQPRGKFPEWKPPTLRGVNINLTHGEIKAALEAIGQMTDGNARDFGEWKLATNGTRAEWAALLRAEAKLREARAG